MGGGVGGINYAEFADGTDLNYKFYNLRGDVVMTLGSDGAVKSASYYHAFGKHDDKLGGIETDKHRANTKVEDDDGLLNEGKRFRSLEYAIFLTPDPLEYQDGLNFYLYCGQNPWGRFDPLGLNAYLGIWFSDSKTGEVGHAGAAFDNYKEEKYTKRENGKDVEKSRMVPDGTVTYYDKWPYNPVEPDEYAKYVRPDYSNGIVMAKNDFFNSDPTGNREGNVSEEGRPADGIVEFDTTYEQDQKSKKYAEEQAKGKVPYNLTFDQCSNFAQDSINSGAHPWDKINGSETIETKEFYVPNFRVVTPNSLYNSAIKARNAKRIRGPETPVKSTYQEFGNPVMPVK